MQTAIAMIFAPQGRHLDGLQWNVACQTAHRESSSLANFTLLDECKECFQSEKHQLKQQNVVICQFIRPNERPDYSVLFGRRECTIVSLNFDSFKKHCCQWNITFERSKGEGKGADITVREGTSPLREITRHMGSHSVNCHPAVVTFPPLPTAEAGTRFRDPGGMQGWVDMGGGYIPR